VRTYIIIYIHTHTYERARFFTVYALFASVEQCCQIHVVSCRNIWWRDVGVLALATMSSSVNSDTWKRAAVSRLLC